MRAVALLLIASVILLSNSCFAAGEATPAPVPPKPDKWELSSAWINAIERLRMMPKPGEIMNSSIRAGINDVMETPAPASENIEKLVAGYDAEALKLAAKWEDELKALRAGYEQKLIAELPAEKRELAKNLLDYSHDNALNGIGRDEKFRKDFAAKQAEFRGRYKEPTPEEKMEATGLLNQWVKAENNNMRKEIEDVVEGLRKFLTPEESQRLEKFNRHRTVGAVPPAQPEEKK